MFRDCFIWMSGFLKQIFNWLFAGLGLIFDYPTNTKFLNTNK